MRAVLTNRNYNNGRAKEYRAMQFLMLRGYARMRSSQSRGPADIMAGKEVLPGVAKVLAVQSKGGSSRFGAPEADRLIEFARQFGAVAMMVGRGNRWYIVSRPAGKATGHELSEVDGEWF